MSSNQWGAPGSCHRVGPGLRDRHLALQALVQPREVQHLFRHVPGLPVRFNHAEDVASWLQTQLRTGSLRYIQDPEYVDVWCSPALTLHRGGGDCDDLSILVLSMLRYVGLCSTAMNIGTLRTSIWTAPAGHAWVEGQDNHDRGFLIEATTGHLHRQLPSGYSRTQRIAPEGFRAA